MPAGRPRKFKSPEEMQVAIDQYFKDCDTHTQDVVTKGGKIVSVSDPEPYTITGLALALDTTRQTLLTYEKEYEPEFLDTIRKAKNKCQQWAELHSIKGKANPAGAIFNLKCNYGYQDKQVIEHQGGLTLNFDKQDEGAL